VTPRQLPGTTRHFIGRAAELARLDELLERCSGTGHTATVAAITGTAGVGKTTLALHWAHRAAASFPDGQLFLNLRGFGPSGTPVSTGYALRTLLEALGVRPSRLPSGIDAQTGLYRSLTADKRLLIVLDNAHDADHIRALIPASPSCMVLVTSRDQLTGLVTLLDAQPVSLDLPSAQEARELLTRRAAADRFGHEPARTLDELTTLCARLPLALSVAAGYLAAHPQAQVASLVARLRDTRSRLAALDAGDEATDVRAVFSWSFRQLDETAARVFRLLSVHPGPDIALTTVASVAGLPIERARPALDLLTRAHLLVESSPDRFTMHDLLRTYCAELAEIHENAAGRRDATLRMLDHYLHTAMRASRAISPQRERPAVADAAEGVVLPEVENLAQALAWYASERPALHGVIARAHALGFPSHAFQIAWATTVYFYQGAYWDDWLATQLIALAAAEELGDTAGQARAQRNIGMAHSGRGDAQRAHAHMERALGLQIAHGHLLGEASTLEALAVSHGQHGDIRKALHYSQRAVEVYRELGHRPGQASALNSVGWFHARLGDYDSALACCSEALELFEELGLRFSQAGLWDTFGYIHHQLGEHDRAVACYDRAVALHREFGARQQLADTLDQLGDAQLAADDADAARKSWHEALTVYEDLEVNATATAAIRRKLAPWEGLGPG